jgi:hypothetical protein
VYGTFFDDAQKFWCIKPASSDALYELARALTLCKHAHAVLYQSADAPKPVLTQDLVVGAEGEALAMGDTVKVVMQVWLTSATHPKGLGALVGTCARLKLSVVFTD